LLAKAEFLHSGHITELTNQKHTRPSKISTNPKGRERPINLPNLFFPTPEGMGYL
jgi:hypothetical protein